MKSLISAVTIIIIIILGSCSDTVPDEIVEIYNDLPEQLDFNIDVKPILSDKCYACHGPDKGNIKAGLQLHTAETAYGLTDSGNKAIVPGKPFKSELVRRIVSHDPELMMPEPSSNLELTDREKAILIKWIEDGAKYEPHWAFIKPVKQNVPEIKDQDWAKNEIDYFITKKLEAKSFQPKKEEERSLLLRRLSLDLVGLPPTPEQMREFEMDTSPDAYEKQIDRLLASPHYGEKMAMDWMDVARYADTHGYTVDRYRDMSPWRTWVIESFNQNMSYDQFLSWQIAGDLYDNPSKEMLLATGFNRLHPQNMEGGIVDEEFRVEYVSDRASVLGQGAIAMTMACAKCHDHKYDPISQKEFYEFYAYFNNINETGQISWDDNDMPVPTILWPTETQEKVINYLKELEMGQKNQLESARSEGRKDAQKWITDNDYRGMKLDLTADLVADISLDGNLVNGITGKSGKMDINSARGEMPTFSKGRTGDALLIDGDAWLDTKPVGIYKRNDAFSIGLWVHLPDSLKEGVIFHKNSGARLHSFKGYHLYYREGKLEVLLAHTWPDNAIEKHTVAKISANEWVHLAMTYDGSSQAEGLRLYVNGEEMTMQLINDNLYKDIVFGTYKDGVYNSPVEPALTIGGRWRGFGIKNALVEDIKVYNKQLTGLEVLTWANEKDPDWISEPLSSLNEGQKRLLEEHYISRYYKPYRQAEQEILYTRTALVDSTETVQEVMVMKEKDNKRKSYLLERGLYSEHREEVTPGVPSSIFPMPEDYPQNRLGLAQWMFHTDHPLTARVAVNRYWQNFFGRGIVRTTEDFGNQGESPSHPRLLDHLAVVFLESGWDVKALHKMIAMSATYRQTSIASEDELKNDPDNTWLARGPKVRMSSEMIRDNALASSGLLVRKIGGPSVKPYQPEGLWQINGGNYVQDTGENLYRRSIYTLWKRSVPNPTQSTFDQPGRSECTVRRQKTNTPLQALVLLNDPTFVEAAKKIGQNIAESKDLKAGIISSFMQLTGRVPKEDELKLLLELRDQEYQNFRTHPEKAKGWLAAGDYQVDKQIDRAELAANAVVASVIINSDAAITKR